MKEFDDLVLSYVNLDLSQKKTVLLTSISESIQVISDNLKKEGLDGNVIESNVLDNLALNDDNEYLAYVYTLVKQFEDIAFKYINIKKRD